MEIDNDNLINIKQRLIAREFDKFYSSKNGEGYNNLDLMADSLENLNTCVSYDLKKAGKIKITQKIKEVLLWYRTLENNPKCYIKTQDGSVFDIRYYHKCNEILTKYFTILKDYIEELGLIR